MKKVKWTEKAQQLELAGYTWIGWRNDPDFVEPPYCSEDLDSWTDGAGIELTWDYTQLIYWGCDSSD